MQILKAKWIITSNENFEILKDKAIAFDKRIVDVGDEGELLAKFPNANFSDLGSSIIAPAFINTHVHLEFSANKTTLKYGDFIDWLGSIIEYGANLKCTDEVMLAALKQMLRSGVGTIGAVSSFGKDLQILANSPARVVFFNEILGSNPAVCEQNWKAFLERFSRSCEFKSKRFTSAISLHSPYSIHPNLAKLAVEFAKNENLLVSTHFLESSHELEWLTHASGKFKAHLTRFIKSPTPLYTPSSFLAMFDELRTLFTHCVFADFNELKFDPTLHSITHCAVSNRLLGQRALNISEILRHNLTLNIGTDGLSSNISLNFFDELRAALFTHSDVELNELAQILFIAATRGGAQNLGLENGVLMSDKFADIAVYESFDEVDESSLVTQLLLHTKQVKQLYVGGELVKF